ncbi:MAG: acetyl-CoA carboxylase biotin carboxyl carrier protein [Saprospiraceae bacterium]|nr:acetyl-CoA carboxylase biotin carboxyl carrier protein [Saprospiraceae bacterium]
MTNKEITELIKLISKSNLTEFKVKDKDFELTIRTEGFVKGRQPAIIQAPTPQVVSVPQQMPGVSTTPPPAPSEKPAAASAAPAEKAEAQADGNYVEIKSPMVGTFYRSASPEKPAYVNVGDKVGQGKVVCIIEAMKLFNEIESEISGKIVKVLVDDAQPVEYDQPLFLVDPKG